MADNGPNAFDLVRLFLGDVTRRPAPTITRDAHGVDRLAEVALRNAAGAPRRVELDWSYPGELKDIEVRLADGTVRTADMLDGSPGLQELAVARVRRRAARISYLGRSAWPRPRRLAALELVAPAS